MKAVRYHSYGDSGVLVYEDADRPGAGPGQVVRMGGTARVSVVVDDLWRAQVLHRELRERGLQVTCVSTVEQHIGVRTAYSTLLTPLAAMPRNVLWRLRRNWKRTRLKPCSPWVIINSASCKITRLPRPRSVA